MAPAWTENLADRCKHIASYGLELPFVRRGMRGDPFLHVYVLGSAVESEKG
jgi:hypothetical protein